jgi:hypothetical protein
MGDDRGIQRMGFRREELPQLLGGISAKTLIRMLQDGEFSEATVYARRVPLWSSDVIRSWLRGE